MTNKEAIEILKHERDNDCFVGTTYRRDVHQALDLAIEALKLADEVDEISEKIGKTNYGPDFCLHCAYVEASTTRLDDNVFCGYYGIKVGEFDLCQHYKERGAT